jgi:CHC2 zinc finger
VTPIETVVAKFGLKLRRQGRELVGPCPTCGGRDRFAVSPSKQLWNCRGCSRGGNAIDLVRHVDGCSYGEAVRALEGERISKHVASAARSIDDDRRSLNFAEQIWSRTTQLAPEATAYFDRRSIPINDVPDHGGLRWHANCPWEGGTKSCILGRYTTAVDNKPRGIWRRPIDGASPKALGPTAGCVIRLWPDAAVETGLVLVRASRPRSPHPHALSIEERCCSQHGQLVRRQT